MDRASGKQLTCIFPRIGRTTNNISRSRQFISDEIKVIVNHCPRLNVVIVSSTQLCHGIIVSHAKFITSSISILPYHPYWRPTAWETQS